MTVKLLIRRRCRWIDLLIVVGGDGSMLKMAKFVVPDDVPV